MPSSYPYDIKPTDLQDPELGRLNRLLRYIWSAIERALTIWINGNSVGSASVLNLKAGTNVTIDGVSDSPGRVDVTINSSGGGGGTIAHTTNILEGDGTGNAIDSGIPASSVVPSSRAINTTAPLSGGGDLSVDRTLAISDATPSTKGVVQPDNTTVTISGGILSATGSGGTVTHTGGPLTADQPVFGAGGGDVKVGTKSGNTDEVMTATGPFTGGHLLKVDASGNAIDGGAPPAIPTIAATTDLLKGDGAGNAIDSTIDPANVVQSSRNINTTAPLAGGGNLSSDLTLSVGTATTSVLGVVKPDGTTITIAAGVISAALPAVPNFADNEVPSGSINSSNTVFTFAHAPSPAGSLELFRNGLLQVAGTDFTLSGATVTFTAAPLTGDDIRGWYRY